MCHAYQTKIALYVLLYLLYPMWFSPMWFSVIYILQSKFSKLMSPLTEVFCWLYQKSCLTFFIDSFLSASLSLLCILSVIISLCLCTCVPYYIVRIQVLSCRRLLCYLPDLYFSTGWRSVDLTRKDIICFHVLSSINKHIFTL